MPDDGMDALDETTVSTELVANRAPLSLKQALLSVLGLLVLVVGVVVLVLGRGAASESSDDLQTAQRRVEQQRAATRETRHCTADINERRPDVVKIATELFAVSEQIFHNDEVIVAATRDQRIAGVNAQLDEYNSAVDRGNAAISEYNRLADQANLLEQSFRNTGSELQRSGC